VARPCPTCRKPVAPRPANPAHPFCSPRCRLLDLGRWLEADYRIPGERAGDGAAGPAPPDDEEGPG
jgi:endogenous inhibitor of DNA gyrase (YacG/DUF329 family)